MTARWHLGPISGFHFWAVLVTSPEVLVFLFFMITDPKTAPRGARARIVYGVSLGLLAALLIAPTTTEFASKVALLGALAIVCVALPLLRGLPRPRRRAVSLCASCRARGLCGGSCSSSSAVLRLTPRARPVAASHAADVTILPSRGVRDTARRSDRAADRARPGPALPAARDGRVRIWLVQGTDQGPPTAVAHFAGEGIACIRPRGANGRSPRSAVEAGRCRAERGRLRYA